VIKLPCVGMLPPPFVDFALSRRFAGGVMLAGCPANDCFHRLGNEWTMQRMARQRDPHLRQRVPGERLDMVWLPPGAARRRANALAAFRASLRRLHHE
jgi:coenzyme F420-reducing hydrogenase delta subunit